MDLRKIGIKPYVAAALPPQISPPVTSLPLPEVARVPTQVSDVSSDQGESAGTQSISRIPTPRVLSVPPIQTTTGRADQPALGNIGLDSRVPIDDRIAADSDFQQSTSIGPLESTAPTIPTALGPQGFKARLDAFDAMIMAEAGINQQQLDAARNHVATIMVELKENPEYDGMLIDRDVHNIMLYVRASASFTKSEFVLVNEKKTKAAVKKSNSKINTTFDLSLLTGIAMEPTTKIEKAASRGVDAFADLNVDDIVAQMQNGRKK